MNIERRAGLSLGRLFCSHCDETSIPKAVIKIAGMMKTRPRVIPQSTMAAPLGAANRMKISVR